MNQVIVIYGPTAVGKSSVAIKLAQMINGEIISADSMQIYKHLNIGSAKVTQEEMQGVQHHLLDILEPDQEYSASMFVKDAKLLCEQIIARNHIPIIVGGTGLYLNGLINCFNFGETDKNAEFRTLLNQYTNEELYLKIKQLAPNEQVDSNNRRRLIRTLEKLTFGKQSTKKISDTFDYLLFAIVDDRQKIYERINNRIDDMLFKGLLDEAKYVYDLNLPDDNLAVKAIGYKEFFPYFKGEMTLNECTETLKQKTRNYAKRQFTYMNQFKNLTKIEFCGALQTATKIYNILEDKQ